MKIYTSKNIIILLLLIGFCCWPKISLAVESKTTYPKLANYFLKWTINDYEVEELAKWDVLILDMEVQENSRAQLIKIRELNPDIVILAYITSQEANADIYNSEWSSEATLRKRLVNNIYDGWWLKNNSGSRVSNWPGTYMLNLTDGAKLNFNNQRWNDYLPNFINDEIISTGLWDGIFYDNIWGDVAWAGSNLDADNNSQTDITATLNNNWISGTKKMLQTTRNLIGDNYLILGNGKVYTGYQSFLNGVMFENFPASWESNGDWSDILTTYKTIKNNNDSPNITIINSYDGNRQNYKKMRYGLVSTLMENHGYFSFDFSNSDHGQVWWYDEYGVNLGQAVSSAYNLLNKRNTTYTEGLWRRDFTEGSVIINSTDKEQLYIFSNEEFERINGTQDRSINNGSVINYIKLASKDGVILLKKTSTIATIKNSGFNNGDYIRVFSEDGRQTRSGFFAYSDGYPANSQIIISDINNDNEEETLVNSGGIISIYKNNIKLREFKPYDGKFKGELSLAVADLNGDGTKEIITGAGSGGGPHVRIFNEFGKILTGGFFAYDKGFRGGVKVAVMDLNGDGTQEIITGAGIGGGPHIRIFDKDGRSLTGGFFAYNQSFRGGVSLAVGDINGDGQKEIITVPQSKIAPEVKIYSKDGKMLKSFLAYDTTFASGFRVMSDDLDNDGIYEILVGTISF